MCARVRALLGLIGAALEAEVLLCLASSNMQHMQQGVFSEAEVLLYPGIKLKVVGAMEMGGGLFQVHVIQHATMMEMGDSLPGASQGSGDAG